MRLILLTILAFFIVTPVSAQENPNNLSDAEIEESIEPVIKDVEGLRIKLIEHPQDPETKNVRFTVVVYSQIRSDRVQLRWSLNGGTDLITPYDQVSFRVDPGTVKTTQIVVKPRTRGVSILSVEVEAFEIEGSYLSTGFKRIYSLGDGRRLPITSTYNQLEIVVGVKGTATTFLQIALFLLIIRAGYGIFQKWLNRTEEIEGII